MESVQCRINYVQSACNTATAMKLCENYIIDGDHCVDVLTQCRNMTFENDKESFELRYLEYIETYTDNYNTDIDDYGGTFTNSEYGYF